MANAYEPTSVSIRDVADELGVSISSVSRVLSDHPDVSESMRKRVLETVDRLGYEPDLLAQSMRSGSTKTIAFALRDIANPLFANIARRCEQELRRAGYSMLITSSDGDVDAEARNLAMLRRRKVDGVIASLVSERAASTVGALKSLSCPIVLLDREVEGIEAGSVVCDHYTGTYNAVTELLRQGHTRVVLITGDLEVRSSRERLRAYEDAFRDAGAEIVPEYLCLGGFDDEYAKRSAMSLLSSAAVPSAFVTGGIGSTTGVLTALHQRRLKIGTDVALIALDDWPLFDILAPQVSTVRRDSGEMGAAAAQLILGMVEGAQPATVTIDTVFVPRGSITTSRGG